MTIGLLEKTITKINDIMESKKCSDWEPDTEDPRYIKYKCHCGKDGRTLKQGISRPTWNGCSECSKKKTSNEVKENITKIIEEAGYELVSIGENAFIKECEFRQENHQVKMDKIKSSVS